MQNIGPGPLHGALKGVPKEARRKLLTTVAYKLGNTPAWYALEGSIAIAGAGITWLRFVVLGYKGPFDPGLSSKTNLRFCNSRDNLELIESYQEVEQIARMDSSAGGLFFVPAFQGKISSGSSSPSVSWNPKDDIGKDSY